MGFLRYMEYLYTPDQTVDTQIDLTAEQNEIDHSLHHNRPYMPTNHTLRAQGDPAPNIPNTRMEGWLLNEQFIQDIPTPLNFQKLNWNLNKFVDIESIITQI